MAELMDQLLQKGWLVSAKTSYGEGIRTATNKERGISRQPAAQVDGQITMENQENKAPKKKKRAEGKHHLTCIGAVARKMCNIIYAVVKNNQPYVPKA